LTGGKEKTFNSDKIKGVISLAKFTGVLYLRAIL
jgi:hypothetical protein